MEIRRAQDQRGLACDRVVEQFGIGLGQACSPGPRKKSGRVLQLRFKKPRASRNRALCTIEPPPSQASASIFVTPQGKKGGRQKEEARCALSPFCLLALT